MNSTARRLKRDADFLIKKGSLETAYALLVSALEEIEKQNWSARTRQPKQNHKEKQKSAGLTMLAEHILSILDSNGIEWEDFASPKSTEEYEKYVSLVSRSLADSNLVTVASQFITGGANHKKNSAYYEEKDETVLRPEVDVLAKQVEYLLNKLEQGDE